MKINAQMAKELSLMAVPTRYFIRNPKGGPLPKELTKQQFIEWFHQPSKE